MRWNRYKILSASAIKDNLTPEKATQIILDTANLDSEQYRLGKTKVSFTSERDTTLLQLKPAFLVYIKTTNAKPNSVGTNTSFLNSYVRFFNRMFSNSFIANLCQTSHSYLATCKQNRYSSVLECWVRWRNFVTNVLERSSPGCSPGSEVTSPGRNSRSCRNKDWPYKSARETCANTSNCAHGHGTNCGRRSSLCSTSPGSRTRSR